MARTPTAKERGPRGVRSGTTATLLGVVACALTACPDPAAVLRPWVADDTFPVAHATIRSDPLPERFTHPLPASVDDVFAHWRDHPRAHVQHRLCTGDPEMVARLTIAVEAAAAAGATPAELRSAYGELVARCYRPAKCAWARDAVAAGGPLAHVAWVALVGCGAEAEDLFTRPGAPAGPLIRYWSDRWWTEPGFTPRFVPAVADALHEVVARRHHGLTGRAAGYLGSTGDPRAAELLLALHDELPTGNLRDEIIAGLAGLDHPRARELLTAYCARRWHPACRYGAPVDRTEPGRPPPADRLPEEGELEARLAALGLLPRGPLPSHRDLRSRARPTPRRILETRGPVHCVWIEDGGYPRAHDALLYRLAELAGEPLSRAAFEEIPPPVELAADAWLLGHRLLPELPPGFRSGDPYRLHAWLDGRSYRVFARDLGDGYDLDRVVGLLNAIAIDRGAPTRFVALPAGDRRPTCVLAAPRDAILAGIGAGLVPVAVEAR